MCFPIFPFFHKADEDKRKCCLQNLKVARLDCATELFICGLLRHGLEIDIAISLDRNF